MKKIDVLQREFAQLEAKHGRLTPEIIVRAASNKKSPLHARFQWNDRKAAHLHRLETARDLLATYITVTVVERKQRYTVPMYVRDPSLPPNLQGYVSTQGNLSRKHAETILQTELERITGCINRAREIAEVLDVKHPGISAKLEFLLTTTVSVQKALAA